MPVRIPREGPRLRRRSPSCRLCRFKTARLRRQSRSGIRRSDAGSPDGAQQRPARFPRTIARPVPAGLVRDLRARTRTGDASRTRRPRKTGDDPIEIRRGIDPGTAPRSDETVGGLRRHPPRPRHLRRHGRARQIRPASGEHLDERETRRRPRFRQGDGGEPRPLLSAEDHRAEVRHRRRRTLREEIAPRPSVDRSRRPLRQRDLQRLRHSYEKLPAHAAIGADRRPRDPCPRHRSRRTRDARRCRHRRLGRVRPIP